MSRDYRDLLIEQLHGELTALTADRDSYQTLAHEAVAQVFLLTQQLAAARRTIRELRRQEAHR